MKNPAANKGFDVLETIINIHVCMALNTGIQFGFVSKGFRQSIKLGLRFTSSRQQSSQKPVTRNPNTMSDPQNLL